MKSQSTLAKFKRDYEKLLAKYPDVTVCSHSTEFEPKAYHAVADKDGNIINTFTMTLPCNTHQIL